MDMFYSQFGEDKILFDIFERKNSGVCVEVGANDGIFGSTSLFFEKLGWECVLVEPNPALCKDLRKVRKARVYEYAASNKSGTAILHIVEGAVRADGLSTISVDKESHERIKNHGFVSKPVEVRTIALDSILEDARLSGDIDFISIDVEGHEYEVLQGFSIEKWRPGILLVEDNSYFENNLISSYLADFGYVRFLRTGVNDWYAHRTNKKLVNIKSRVSVRWMITVRRLKNRLRKYRPLLKLRNLLRSAS